MLSLIALLALSRSATVMPVGDSIATGGTRPKPQYWNGYREALLSESAKGSLAIKLVGTQEPLTNFVGDAHEGYPAHSIEQMAPKVYRTLRTIKPDYIILTAGTNNCHKGVNPNAVLKAFDRFLVGIHERTPKTKIIVADIPVIVNDPTVFSAEVRDSVCLKLGSLVKKHPYACYVPVWKQRSDLTCIDGYHPSREGYEFFAKKAYESIIQAQ